MKRESKNNIVALLVGLAIMFPMTYWSAMWLAKSWAILAIQLGLPVLSVSQVAVALCIYTRFIKPSNDDYTWRKLLDNTFHITLASPMFYGAAWLCNYLF